MVVNPKKNNDIQLINVAKQGDLHYMADFPYGMALLAAYLRNQGFKTLMLQYPLWKKKLYEKNILENPSFLYGFQVNMENYFAIGELVNLIKEKNPDAKIIYGGPFVVSSYQNLLKNDMNLDAVVLGEGEFTVAELIKKLKAGRKDWKCIDGIAYLKENGEIKINPSRIAIQNLDEMPFAARDGVKEGGYDIEGKYMNDIRITTSRGCTSNCTFCAVNINSKLQKAKRWRGRSPANVVDEIQYLVEKYNVKLINFQDSSFDDPHIERSKLLCEEILSRELEISIKIYLRANNIHNDTESIELYKLYKKAGVDVIIIGAEAGSDYELKIYGKSAKLKDNYRSFRVLNDLNLFFIHSGFIMFGPYSTLETLRQNIKFLWENQLYYWYPNFTTSLILFPGASIYDTLKAEKRIIPSKHFCETPNYIFTSPLIYKLAKHYQYIRTIYPYIDKTSPLVIDSGNILSRLKNKMNKKVSDFCSKETELFNDAFIRIKKELNILGNSAATEHLDRIEKDGENADLMSISMQYFSNRWESAFHELDNEYQKLLRSISEKGFGLGGLVFNSELTARERRTDVIQK